MTSLHIYLFLDSLGGGEILLIMVFVLFFFGSGKIPDIAKGLGRGMREFKDAMGGVQRDIEQSMRETEIKKEETKNSPPATIEQIIKDVKQKKEEESVMTSAAVPPASKADEGKKEGAWGGALPLANISPLKGLDFAGFNL